MFTKLSTKPDITGALASSLCLLHCIATPLLFVFQPLHSSCTSTPLWWSSIDYVFLLISCFAVYTSAKNTSKSWVKYALWLSWVALAIAILNERLELFPSSELTLFIPAIALVAIHLYNQKYCTCKTETCCITH